LKREFEGRGAWRAADMAAIGAADVGALFGLNRGGSAAGQAFAAACARALNETGRFVTGRYGGRFMALVEDADGDAASFVRTLASLDHFNDTHLYRGRAVALHKRAQIAAADLQLA